MIDVQHLVDRCEQLANIQDEARERIRSAEYTIATAAKEFYLVRRQLMDVPGGFHALRQMLERRQKA